MKKTYQLLALLVLVVLMAMGCEAAQEQATPTPIPTPLVAQKQTYTVQRGLVQDIQEFNARISPIVEQQLFFQQSGYVNKIYVERNDTVTKGTLIADLVQESALNSLEQAKVSLEKAQSSYEQAKQANERAVNESAIDLETQRLKLEDFRKQAPDAVDLVTEETKQATQQDIDESAANLEIQRLKLEEFKLNTPDNDIAIAKKRLEQAEIKVQSAQAAYDQVSWKPGIEATSASKNLQSATIDYEIAKATYDEAARAADNYKIELQIQQKSYELAQLRHQQLVNSLDKTVTDATKAAQAKLDTYQLNLSIMEKDYELAQLKQSYLEAGVDPNIEKAVQQAQLSVDKLQTDVDKGRLVAPFDGVISSMALTEGRAVDAYKNVAVISNMDQLELAAQLSDSEMSTLEVSMTVTVTLGTYPGRVFTGIISEMPYPYAKGGSTAKLDTADQFTHVTLDDKTVQLRQGDVATVSVLLEQAENTLWLPPAAIRSFEGRNFVVVEQDGRQARVDIKVGIVGKERIEVLSGVEEGQTIIGQ